MIKRHRFLWVTGTILGLAVLVLACGPGQPPAVGTPGPEIESPEAATATPAAAVDSPLPTPAREERLTPEVTRLPELVPGVTPGTPVTGEVPAGILAAILADLAGRLGVSADEIQVVRGESVVWNDGSLGCPEPGMMYTQALVDGYWVVLEQGGQTYDYRATTRGYFRLCESPALGEPGLPSDRQ
jgi:hypothetical protein